MIKSISLRTKIDLLKSNLIKLNNMSYYLIASLLSSFIGIAINPFLALGLNHEDYAIIGYYSSFATVLMPIIAFSFNSYYARNYFLVSEKERNDIYRTLMCLFSIFGAFVFVLFYFLYYLYHITNVKSIPFSPYAILSFLPIYFSSFYNIYLLKLRMEQKAKKYMFITLANTILGASLSVIFVYIFHYGAQGRLSALLLVAIASGIYALKLKNFRFILNKKIVKEAFLFCWPLATTAILTFFFMGIDRVFLAKLNDNHLFGLYNVGLQISGYIGIFGTVVFQTFEPDFFKYTSLKQHKKVLYLFIVVISLSFIPNIIFILLSEPLIDILTHGKYIEASDFADILCVKNITTTFAFIISNLLVGYGLSKYELFNKTLGALLSVVLYKFLIENYGFYGAAWGQSISWVLMGFISLVTLMLVRKKYNLGT